MNDFKDFSLWFLLLIPWVFIPSPINLLLFVSGGTNGLVRTLPMISGMLMVTLIYHLAIEFGIFYLFEHYKFFFLILNFAGIAYVFYMSYQLFFIKQKYSLAHLSIISPSFWRGLGLNFSNLNLIVYMITAGTHFADERASMTYEIFSLVAADLSLLFVAYVSWTFMGSVLAHPRWQLFQNKFFGSLLLLVGFWMLADILQQKQGICLW